jgi:hypothetical protein
MRIEFFYLIYFNKKIEFILSDFTEQESSDDEETAFFDCRKRRHKHSSVIERQKRSKEKL